MKNEIVIDLTECFTLSKSFFTFYRPFSRVFGMKFTLGILLWVVVEFFIQGGVNSGNWNIYFSC